MADFLILDENKKDENNNSVNNNSPLVKGDLMKALNDYIVSMQSIKTKEKVIFYRLLSTMTNA
jgi:hypothetical protein